MPTVSAENFRPAALTETKQLTSNQLIILSEIKRRPQSVYRMSKGVVAELTGLTLMAIRKVVKTFESNGWISSSTSKNDGRKAIVFAITECGTAAYDDELLKPIKTAPRSLADVYCIQQLKTSSIVRERLKSMLTNEIKHAKSDLYKSWLYEIM